MQLSIDPGDKVTLVIRDAVLVCQVLIVRARAPGEDDANASEDAATKAEVELQPTDSIALSVPDHGHTSGGTPNGH